MKRALIRCGSTGAVLAALGLFLTSAPSADKADSGWINLFNGTSLDDQYIFKRLNGAVDRIDRISAIVDRLRISAHIHCDGALGGLLLPFMDGAPRITFKETPIDSIAVSGHKFVGTPVPCGVVLTRRPHVRQMETAIEYIGSTDTTIMGSRNGLAVLFLWYAISERGQAFPQEVAECVQNARYLRDRLEQLGYHPLLNDFSTTVVFDRPAAEVCRTWQLACQGERAHVVVMQNLDRERLDRFLDELRRSRVTDW